MSTPLKRRKRPFKVNSDGDVEMAQGRTFDFSGGTIKGAANVKDSDGGPWTPTFTNTSLMSDFELEYASYERVGRTVRAEVRVAAKSGASPQHFRCSIPVERGEFFSSTDPARCASGKGTCSGFNQLVPVTVVHSNLSEMVNVLAVHPEETGENFIVFYFDFTYLLPES